MQALQTESLYHQAMIVDASTIRMAPHKESGSVVRDGRVEAAVRDAGYSYACTIQGGRNSTAQNRMRLARIDITRQRVLDRHGRHDELGFRSEVSLLRSWWRGFATSEWTGCGAMAL